MRYPLAILTALVAACGSGADNGFLADLEDHEAPLTAAPGDDLFTVEVFEAQRVYPTAGLTVLVNPYGGPVSAVEFALTVDEDGDGALGLGDILTAREGAEDAYNASHSGTLFEVVITFADESGATRDLASLQWVGDGGLGLTSGL